MTQDEPSKDSIHSLISLLCRQEFSSVLEEFQTKMFQQIAISQTEENYSGPSPDQIAITAILYVSEMGWLAPKITQSLNSANLLTLDLPEPVRVIETKTLEFYAESLLDYHFPKEHSENFQEIAKVAPKHVVGGWKSDLRDFSKKFLYALLIEGLLKSPSSEELEAATEPKA